VWTEYDAPHSHSNDHWETFGLLQTSIPGVDLLCNTFTGFPREPTLAQLDSATYAPKATYVGFKHVAKFIQPGGTRIFADSPDPDLNTTGVLNPDCSVVVVGYNRGGAGSIALQVANVPAPLGTISVFASTATQSFATQTGIPVINGSATVSVAANS